LTVCRFRIDLINPSFKRVDHPWIENTANLDTRIGVKIENVNAKAPSLEIEVRNFIVPSSAHRACPVFRK
jgi:hypothetical protein